MNPVKKMSVLKLKSRRKKTKDDKPKLVEKVTKVKEKDKLKCKHSEKDEVDSCSKAKLIKTKEVVKDEGQVSKGASGTDEVVNLQELRTISSGKSVTIPVDAFQSLVDYVRYVKYM